MTNSAGKRRGITGRFLLVPPDLCCAAGTILSSELVPGANNSDIPFPFHTGGLGRGAADSFKAWWASPSVIGSMAGWVRPRA